MEPRELTDEEKDMHDKVYGMAASILYDEQFLPKAKEMFEKAGSPVAAASTLAVALGAKVLEAAGRSGKQIPSAALLSAGWAVMTEIQDFAKQVMKTELTREQVEAAFFNAADQLSDIAKSGDAVRMDITPQERQQMMKDAGGEAGLEEMRRKARQMATGEDMPEPPSRGLGARP